jgi:anaerobic selenocysteine-containing dehydrogenase/Fe-S-cluster-containing dehydrogenase component
MSAENRIAKSVNNTLDTSSVPLEQSTQTTSLKKNKITRRGFFKIIGSGATVGLTACAGDKTEHIVARITSDDRHIPGVPLFYSTTCTECSAGCGIVATSFDGRVTKIEGNTLHPINKGGVCALGHSSLQNLYDPDRVREPLKKVISTTGIPKFQAITWSQAFSEIGEKLAKSQKKNIVLSGESTGSINDLIENFSKKFNGQHIQYDLLAPESLAYATQLVFGINEIPSYRFNQANLIVNFGADFLETWISPVEFSRDWASIRSSDNPGKLAQIESRLSMTGSNSDIWLRVETGTEVYVALGILNKLLSTGRGRSLPKSLYQKLKTLAGGITFDLVVQKTGISKEKLLLLSDAIQENEKVLFIAGTIQERNIEGNNLQILVQLLNLIMESHKPSSKGGLAPMDFTHTRKVKSSFSSFKKLLKELEDDAVDILFVTGTNPVFTVPSSFEVKESFNSSKLLVALSSHMDETAIIADYILPISTSLESWGDSNPVLGTYSLLQPTMAPIFNTKSLGDILLLLAESANNPIWSEGEEKSYRGYLRNNWKNFISKYQISSDFNDFWKEAIEKGGWFTDESSSYIEAQVDDRVFAVAYGQSINSNKNFKSSELTLMPFINIKGYDGRAANRSWLQELPDTITQSVWDSWVELHPKTAEVIGDIKTGDLITIRSYNGEVNAPAYVTNFVSPGTLAIPIGQGHDSYGRYAQSVKGGNVLKLLSAKTLGDTVTPILVQKKVSATKALATYDFVTLSGSDSQHDRELARTRILPLLDKYHDKSDGHTNSSHVHYEVKQMYEQRVHPLYQWGMVVDLAACTGCSACVVACSSENNIAVVGKRLCSKGREMSWIRIERYYDNVADSEDPKVSFLPMMCQHCQNAPCEPVCPVYATYHNEDGMNVMVYNRCVGTRYCSNNCSYKVRRFNWVSFDFPEPLDWQLNPNVTRRTSGVMEKCTFCVQRINSAKDKAKDEGRLVLDGEVKPACVQSCPTKALTFGNLKDSNSEVARAKNSERAYKVLDHHLNTQPSVVYLEDIKYRI